MSGPLEDPDRELQAKSEKHFQLLHEHKKLLGPTWDARVKRTKGWASLGRVRTMGKDAKLENDVAGNPLCTFILGFKDLGFGNLKSCIRVSEFVDCKILGSRFVGSAQEFNSASEREIDEQFYVSCAGFLQIHMRRFLAPVLLSAFGEVYVRLRS